MTRRRYGSDRGSATAEIAVALPAVVLLLVVGLTAVTAVRTQLECLDAAREAARAAARGDPGEAAGARVAPAGATVAVVDHGDTTVATVRAHVRPFGGWNLGIDVGATAVAATEPGVAP
jgi:Flp pilus assembly protein TadG